MSDCTQQHGHPDPNYVCFAPHDHKGPPVKTMADIIWAHLEHHGDEYNLEYSRSIRGLADNLTELLTAAGYGPAKEARMAAWDEGADHAWESSGEGWNGEYPGHAFDKSANPYRAATEDAEP